MLKREVKLNVKNWLIWTGIMAALYIAVIAVYPIILDGNEEMIDAMMASFSEETLKAFNMDIASISNATGWIMTEGAVYFVLVGGLFASILGSNILLKEESDMTIEYLYSKPVSRSRIFLAKFVCGIIYVTAFVIVAGGTTIIALKLLDSDNLQMKKMLLLLGSPVMSMYVFFALSLFISTFFHKTKKMLGISFALVFIAYFIQMIGLLSDKIENIKYFSIFTLCESRYIIEHTAINNWNILITMILVAVFTAGAWFVYNRKELC
ncbi:MAG: ABC transporter permease subunit [Eubacterium sp.]